MLACNLAKILVVAFAVMQSVAWSGSRFQELKTEGRFCKECILFNTIAYPDSEAIYRSDLKEFIKTQTFGKVTSKTGMWYDIDTSQSDIQGFALYMVVPLCWNDIDCKELLWHKRYGKDGYMSFEMYRAISLLSPEKLPELLNEFKKYPVPQWRNYSLSSFSFLSLHPEINAKLADSLKVIVQKFQMEWRHNPKFSKDIMKTLSCEVDNALLIQKERRIYAGHPVFKPQPVVLDVLIENLIHDEKWDRICPEIDSLIKNKLIWLHPESSEMLLPWLIQHKCGTINKSDSIKLRRVLLGPTYTGFIPSASPATPVIFKLLREYTQELLAEQKKKNPVKWRIWPGIVKPLK